MPTNWPKSAWRDEAVYPCRYCGAEFKTEQGRWAHWQNNRSCKALRLALSKRLKRREA